MHFFSNKTYKNNITSFNNKGTSNRFVLYVAFATVLTLFVLAVLVGVYQTYESNSKLQEITNNINVKIVLVDKMHNAARERTLALYIMSTISDPFEQDDLFLLFNKYGAEFADARSNLIDMNLNSVEKKMISSQGKITSMVTPVQDKIIDLIQKSDIANARLLLAQQALPGQRMVLDILAELKAIQFNAAQEFAQQADETHTRSYQYSIVLGLFAMLLGLLITLRITRRVSLIERSLFMEKQLAKTTLESIGDAVLTTDESGKITAINKVASCIIDCSEKESIGQAVSSIFKIYNESDQLRKYKIDPVIKVLSERVSITSGQELFLLSKNNKEYSIEFNISPILDSNGYLHGSVVVFRDVTEMRTLSTKLSYQASHDTLTGLVNRREFEKCINNALNSARKQNKVHVLCFMDLDQLKVINDTAGHKAGDEMLKQIANKLPPVLRGSDVLARIGGDEFGVLLESCDLASAMVLAEKFRITINEDRFSWGNNSYDISISIGLVLVDADSGDLSDVLGAADAACMLAKENGRNRIEQFTADSEVLIKRRNETRKMQDITRAIEQDQFVLYCQEIKAINDKENELPFYEILVRMKNDDGEIIPPMSFIPAGERYNLMPELDKHVIKKVFEIYPKLSAIQPQLSINISGQSIGDELFLDYVCDIIQSSSIPHSLICFEITETAAIANMSTAIMFVERLRDLGCKFALDDFGSGLSSFGYLKKLKVDYLKIDGSFVRDIVHDSIDLAFVEAIHRIGEMMKIRTIAEYVENQNTLDKIHEIGINYAQGYYIGKPMLFEELM
jgi:diguanylate cyclase (GGDEF)-like protein/PAS domain S-box-containing protein